jgi:hypothetical protein
VVVDIEFVVSVVINDGDVEFVLLHEVLRQRCSAGSADSAKATHLRVSPRHAFDANRLARLSSILSRHGCPSRWSEVFRVSSDRRLLS